MKLSKRDVDIVSLIIQPNRVLSINEVIKTLQITQKQLTYSITKINKYLSMNSNENIFIEKGRINITNKEVVQDIFGRFRAVTTPEHYRYCSKVIRNYILLKLLITDEYVPINYFTDTLFVSRTTITKAMSQCTDFLVKEGITFERILRRGYKITTNNYHRFYLFAQILRDTISVREIYLFYYNQQEVYSKQAELILFTIFDCDELLQNIEKIISFSKKTSDEHIDDNRFLVLLILTYKLAITPKNNPLTSLLKGYIKKVEETKQLVNNGEEKVHQLVCYINKYLSDNLGWEDVYSKEFWLNIRYPILKFIYRVENNTEVKYLDVDNKFIIKKHTELFKTIKSAITTFAQGRYRYTSDKEVVLITAHYITELEKRTPKLDRSLKILAVTEGDKTFSNLLVHDIHKHFQYSIIKSVSNFEFLEEYLEQYDLILTTVPLINIKSTKIIYVHYPLSPNLIETISRQINTLNSKITLDGLYKFPRLMLTIKESCGTLVHQEILELSLLRILCSNEIVKPQTFNNSIIFDENSIEVYDGKLFWKEALKITTQILVTKGISDNFFYKVIIDKINTFGLYMQLFPGILIIHNFDSNRKCGLTISIFRKGIMFPGINKINIIIYLFSDTHKGYIILERLARWFSKLENVKSCISDEKNKLYESIQLNILNNIE